MALGQMVGLVVFALFTGIASAFPSAGMVGVLENLPNTGFSCEGKVIGGYYADIESGCQMFHVCTLGVKGEIHDIKFLCLNGTIFDQETRVCERLDEVDCSLSAKFYDLNLDLYGTHGIILGRNAPKGEGVIFDEEAQASTSILSEDVYVDYDYSEDSSSITAQASSDNISVQKVEEPGSIPQLEDTSRILNSSNITVTNEEPFVPLLRTKRSESDSDVEVLLPDTKFSCAGRVVGGLYADVRAGCQIFHICAQGKKNRIIDHMFLCGKGTLFDQVSRTCQERSKVNCALSEGYYHLNDHFKQISLDYEDHFEFPRIQKENSSLI